MQKRLSVHGNLLAVFVYLTKNELRFPFLCRRKHNKAVTSNSSFSVSFPCCLILVHSATFVWNRWRTIFWQHGQSSNTLALLTRVTRFPWSHWIAIIFFVEKLLPTVKGLAITFQALLNIFNYRPKTAGRTKQQSKVINLSFFNKSLNHFPLFWPDLSSALSEI